MEPSKGMSLIEFENILNYRKKINDNISGQTNEIDDIITQLISIRNLYKERNPERKIYMHAEAGYEFAETIDISCARRSVYHDKNEEDLHFVFR